MSLLDAIIVILGGMASGFINTLAGGGSAITIPILTELLGDVSVANGTNRIAILVANIGAVANFQRSGKVPWAAVRRLAIPAALGAIGGSWFATVISSGVLRRVFAAVILFVALSVLYKPARWVQEREAKLREPWRSLLFFALGFYGGFVQAGVGLMLLSGLVLGGGLDLVRGNAAKVALIAIYTPLTIAVFASAAQVDLAVGAVLAIGQVSGAVGASQLAIAKGANWVRWVLLVAAVAAAIRLGFF